jgi:hypothetical protein
MIAVWSLSCPMAEPERVRSRVRKLENPAQVEGLERERKSKNIPLTFSNIQYWQSRRLSQVSEQNESPGVPQSVVALIID